MLAMAKLGVARKVLAPSVSDALGAMIGAMGPMPPIGDLSAREALAAIGPTRR